MAGNTQATAPAAADTAPKGAGQSSTAGARQHTDNRPSRPDYDALMEESLAQELGDEGADAPNRGSSGGKSTKKGDATGSPKDTKGKGKKLDLGNDEDDEDDGDGNAEEDEEETEAALKKAAKQQLGEDDEESETDEEDEPEQESETEEEDDEEGDEGSKGKKTKPKGMEDWPDAAVERFERYDTQVKALKQQLAIEGITIKPTPDSPFAHIDKAEDLEGLIGQAKGWRKWCQENPEGGTVKLNGKPKELSEEEVQQRLRWAEGILDVDAVSEARERLNYRTEHKPWEDAQRLVPDLFDRKSESFETFASVMKQVPQLRRLNDYEYFVACALRGMRVDTEEQSGAARYVRVEMKDGKPVVQKAKSGEQGAKSKNPKKTPTPAPNGTRTPLKSKDGKADLGAAAVKFMKSRDEADLDAVVRAEMSA